METAGIVVNLEANPMANGRHRAGDVLTELSGSRVRVIEQGRRDSVRQVRSAGRRRPLVLAQRLEGQAPVHQNVHEPPRLHRRSRDVKPSRDEAQVGDDAATPFGNDSVVAGKRQSRVAMPLPDPEALCPLGGAIAEYLLDASQDLLACRSLSRAECVSLLHREPWASSQTRKRVARLTR
jgi:hypothetical protein